MKYTLSDIDAKIKDYETKLRELKTAFLDGVAVQTGITVFRMMNTLERMGRSHAFGLCTASNGLGI
jgi:hypothetical protein